MAIYACSDLHGMLNLYKTIKDFLTPEDKVYFLGDAGDRGPEPWETIKAIMNDPQFIYIKGNHEDMLVDAMGRGYGRQYNLLRSNGGKDTYHQAMEEPNWTEWRARLRDLPNKALYTNTQGEDVYLSHAGFTPFKIEGSDSDTDIDIPCDHDLIWDRSHFYDSWKESLCVNCIIVHGHTPIPYLLNHIDPEGQITEIHPGVLWYNNHHKCCIDCGAVFTGYCTLLNLDTWEEKIFSTKPYI